MIARILEAASCGGQTAALEGVENTKDELSV